jgi:hypothetical protein
VGRRVREAIGHIERSDGADESRRSRHASRQVVIPLSSDPLRPVPPPPAKYRAGMILELGALS